MKIPNSFKQAIKEAFYDKEITPYVSTEVVDDEGFARKGYTTPGEVFNGNVSFNMELVKKEYGIDEEVNIKISTDVDTEAEILEYNGVKYEVVKKVVRDSHIIYLCKECILSSLGLISL
jgi:hypothetical protein